MNIFKILANGHGKVNENNISAFLSYLLDPNTNHSLDYEFLKRFLGAVYDFEYYKYDYRIYLEQGFEGENKKEIIDIIILCYETEQGDKSQSLMKNFIDNNKNIKKVFLIENKINPTAYSAEQLKKQRKNVINNLNLNEDDIFSIYLTPDLDKYNTEFNKYNINNSHHLYWKSVNNGSIINILKNILIDETNGEIEAISNYTKHTLKSFIQFIENDFKSEIEIAKGKKEGLYQKDIHKTIKSLLEKQSNLIDDKLIDNLYQFEKYIETHSDPKITYRCSKTHLISVFYNNKKVFSLTKRSKKIIYHLILRNFKALQKNDSVLENYCKINKFEFISYVDNEIKQGSEYKPYTFEIQEIITIFEKIISFIK